MAIVVKYVLLSCIEKFTARAGFLYFYRMAAVDINKVPTELCEKCGWHFFRNRIMVKNIPGLLVGQVDKQMMLFDFLVCEKCGKPHPSCEEKFRNMVPPPDPDATPPASSPSSASEVSQ